MFSRIKLCLHSEVCERSRFITSRVQMLDVRESRRILQGGAAGVCQNLLCQLKIEREYSECDLLLSRCKVTQFSLFGHGKKKEEVNSKGAGDCCLVSGELLARDQTRPPDLAALRRRQQSLDGGEIVFTFLPGVRCTNAGRRLAGWLKKSSLWQRVMSQRALNASGAAAGC